MSRSEISTEFNTFVGGILTEANPINFPPGYSIDESNFILQRNGTRRRRFGTTVMGYPDLYASNAFSGSADRWEYKDYFVWRDAAYDGENQDMLVIQYVLEEDDPGGAIYKMYKHIGLMFFKMNDSTSIGSSAPDIHIIQRASLQSMSSYVSGLAISSRDLNGIIPNTSQFINVDILTRQEDTDDFSVTNSKIHVRDFKGVESEDLMIRPVNLSDNHAYNLYNSGWLKTDVDAWKVADGTYPATTDSSVFSKNFGVGFSTTIMDNTLFGTTRAPTGKSITEPWYPVNEWSQYATEVTGAGTTDSPAFGPVRPFTENYESVVSQAYYAGRLIYLCHSGRLLSRGSTMLMYSQSGSSPTAYANCYQENDPTSEYLNMLIDTDGGLIDVSEAGQGILLGTSRSRIMILGTKGVYELFSQSDIFTPLALNIRKVSNNVINFDKEFVTWNGNTGIADLARDYYNYTANSLVNVGDNFFYWSENGVTTLTFDPANNQFVEENISAQSIDTLYREIPTKCKAYAKGVYLAEDNTLMWTYGVDEANPGKQTKALCFDMTLKAWSKFDFSTTGDTHVIGAFTVPLESDRTGRSENFKSLTLLGSDSTYSGVVTLHPLDSTFQDFSNTPNAGEEQAFLQTGYLNANDSSKFKQGTYIVPSFLRTEDGFTDDGSGNLTANNESSCTVSAWWDFAEEDTDTKVNPPFEAYRLNKVYIPTGPADTFDYGQSVITTKNRLTGRGRALSLRFETSIGKDCRLLGWNLGFGAVGKV